MNVYSLIPLIVVISYAPLLVTTLSSRPWTARQRLFFLYLLAAIMWSLTDVFLRGNFFPQYNILLLKIVLICFAWTSVQFHFFTSSFFPHNKGKWLIFAFASLAVVIVMILLGYFTRDVIALEGGRLFLDYGSGVIFLAIPLLTLLLRNLYVFSRMLKVLDSPVLYSQIVSLIITLLVLAVFAASSLLPWGREFAVAHFGSLINAFILTFAVIRHELFDIRLVLRRALAIFSMTFIGVIAYILLIFLFHYVFPFSIEPTAIALSIISATLIMLSLAAIRNYLFETLGKAFQGKSFNYRRKLADFANGIHTVFSLQKQGADLLFLVSKAVGSRRAALLFPEAGSGDYIARSVEPLDPANPLLTLRLSVKNPIVDYLKRERQLLQRERLSILPEFRSLWETERAEVDELELFVPLISRDNLTGILVIDRKYHGRYTMEDLSLLEEITSRVAVSFEKEYLRERLREREEELEVINRSSAIITSSLDIQEIYHSFISEIKTVMDINWAAIFLIGEKEIRILAIASDTKTEWQSGETIPLAGTGTEIVATSGKSFYEADLSRNSTFTTGDYFTKLMLRSVAYLPLVSRGKVIGSLVVASRTPTAYNQRQLLLLEQLASQISMPVDNARLYAETEKKARYDELTGLLNRRSLDEIIAGEINRLSRYGGIFSLIILDLDSFKTFNDTYGHPAGDTLLNKLGGVLRGCVRNTDQAFRYGGDEFAILLVQTDIAAASEVAERIRKRVAATLTDSAIPVTASFGIARWPVDGVSAGDILKAADSALYTAKRSGGNQTQRVSSDTTGKMNLITVTDEVQECETLNSVYALAATVDARDQYTQTHSKKVSEYAAMLAKALGMDSDDIRRLETSALLHDIGKICISTDILNKPEKLKAEEWAIVKTHPRLGATIANHARSLSRSIPGILHHHERYDGSGYPDGLKGEEIPLEARILSIADAFSAMTSKRPYSSALTLDNAVKELEQSAGKQFDPRLVSVFLSVIRNNIEVAVREETG